MSKYFVELTLPDSRKILVNIDLVESITEDEDSPGSIINCIGSSENYYTVKETYDEIVDRINYLGPTPETSIRVI